MIPPALGREGVWSRKTLQRQSDGKGKRSGSGCEAGKGATSREKLCFLKLLGGLGYRFVLKSVGSVELVGGLVLKYLI